MKREMVKERVCGIIAYIHMKKSVILGFEQPANQGIMEQLSNALDTCHVVLYLVAACDGKDYSTCSMLSMSHVMTGDQRTLHLVMDALQEGRRKGRVGESQTERKLEMEGQEMKTKEWREGGRARECRSTVVLSH